MDKNRYAVQFEKDKGFLKAFLHGRNYFIALKALGVIERLTAGKFRKDGVMPEMHHMVRLALNAINLRLPHVDPKASGYQLSAVQEMSLEERLITVLLYHDALEDDDTGEITPDFIARKSKRYISDSTWRMTKKYRGEHKDKTAYVADMSEDLIASLGKGLDRNDNLEHMIGTFDLPKIISYTHEARTVYLPMLKKASKLFPEHLPAYQAIMQSMKRNLKFLDHYITISQLREADVKNLRGDLDKADEEIARLSDVVARQAKAIEEFGESLRTADSAIKQTGKSNLNLFTEVIKITPPQNEGEFQKLKRIFGISDLELLSFNDALISGSINERSTFTEELTSPPSKFRSLYDQWIHAIRSDN